MDKRLLIFPGVHGGLSFFDPLDGHFYRKRHLTVSNCCDSRFLKCIFLKRRFNLRQNFEPFTCRVRPGALHCHQSLNQLSFALHTFRWACQLHIIQHKESTNDAIEAVASSWPFTLPFKISQLKKLFSSKSLYKIPNLNIFLDLFGKEELAKAMEVLRTPQPYWIDPFPEFVDVGKSASSLEDDSPETESDDDVEFLELEKPPHSSTGKCGKCSSFNFSLNKWTVCDAFSSQYVNVGSKQPCQTLIQSGGMLVNNTRLKVGTYRCSAFISSVFIKLFLFFHSDCKLALRTEAG